MCECRLDKQEVCNECQGVPVDVVTGAPIYGDDKTYSVPPAHPLFKGEPINWDNPNSSSRHNVEVTPPDAAQVQAWLKHVPLDQFRAFFDEYPGLAYLAGGDAGPKEADRIIRNRIERLADKILSATDLAGSEDNMTVAEIMGVLAMCQASVANKAFEVVV